MFLIAINPVTGQPDYSQQWIEYYRSVGQNDVADEIVRQMKEVKIRVLIKYSPTSIYLDDIYQSLKNK